MVIHIDSFIEIIDSNAFVLVVDAFEKRLVQKAGDDSVDWDAFLPEEVVVGGGWE